MPEVAAYFVDYAICFLASVIFQRQCLVLRTEAVAPMANITSRFD